MPSGCFKFELMKNKEIFKILSNVDPEKACGLDEIPCRMLKDSLEILVEPICCQHFMSSEVSCRL